MKKLAAILFLSLYLLYTTGVKELLKINLLVQHFHETKKTDNTVTFFHFLVMHYVTDDLNDKDNDRDKQLPFKSPETSMLNSALIYIPTPVIFMDFQSFAVNKRDFLAVKDLVLITSYHALVWHPPRHS